METQRAVDSKIPHGPIDGKVGLKCRSQALGFLPILTATRPVIYSLTEYWYQIGGPGLPEASQWDPGWIPFPEALFILGNSYSFHCNPCNAPEYQYPGFLDANRPPLPAGHEADGRKWDKSLSIILAPGYYFWDSDLRSERGWHSGSSELQVRQCPMEITHSPKAPILSGGATVPGVGILAPPLASCVAFSKAPPFCLHCMA